MNKLKKIARRLFKVEKNEIGNGLFASLEELLAIRKDAAYIRSLNRKRSFSQQVGDIKSAFKGRGMELEEVRAYSFGDDVRDIDWRITARKEQPYTKIFNEERDHEIWAWLDLSPQMLFGTKKELKSVSAAKIAALLGWVSLENKDRFGCVIFDGKNSYVFKPQNNRAQLMAILKKIATVSEVVLNMSLTDEINYAKSLKMLEQNVKSRASVFVLSDFNGNSDAEKIQLAALAKKSELFLINIFDVLEEIPPKSGEYMVQYGGKRLIFDSGGKAYQKDYRSYFADKRKKLQSFCSKFGCCLIEFRTDMNIAQNFKIF